MVSVLAYVLQTPDLRVVRVEAPSEARPGETVFIKVEVANYGADGYGWLEAYIDGNPLYRHSFGWFASGTSSTVVLSFIMGGSDTTVTINVGSDTNITDIEKVVVKVAGVPAPPVPPPTAEVVTLIIIAHEGGTTNPAPGVYQLYKGSTVTITAIPNDGYRFLYWLIDGIVSFSNPVTMTLATNKMVEAYFAPLPTPPKAPAGVPTISLDQVMSVVATFSPAIAVSTVVLLQKFKV